MNYECSGDRAHWMAIAGEDEVEVADQYRRVRGMPRLTVYVRRLGRLHVEHTLIAPIRQSWQTYGMEDDK